MPANRARIDVGLVELIQYNVWPNQIAKKPRFKPQPLPKFEPPYINDWDDYRSPNLPPSVDVHDPFKLFKLFFIDKIMDKFVAQTNNRGGVNVF